MMNKSESIMEISKAMANFQKEVKQPMKDKDNPFFKSKYVPLESVVEAITVTANKHGLSFMQFPETNAEGLTGMKTLVMHTSGEWIESETLYMKPEKNTPQSVGSAQTYLRRYQLAAVFGITSDVDDDGNAASGNMNKQTQQNVQITQKELGDVKLAIQNYSKASNVTEETIKEHLNITDYTKLTSADAAAIQNTIKGWMNNG